MSEAATASLLSELRVTFFLSFQCDNCAGLRLVRYKVVKVSFTTKPLAMLSPKFPVPMMAIFMFKKYLVSMLAQGFLPIP